MEIKGQVTKIVNFGSASKPIVFKINDIKNNTNINASYLGFLPVHEGDNIIGLVDNENRFTSKPLVVPAINEDNLKRIMFKIFKGKKFGIHTYNKFADEMLEKCNDINGVFEKLNYWAEDMYSEPFLESLNKSQIKKLKLWWRDNFLKRKLFLLGFNNKEIKFSYQEYDKLYRNTISNPFTSFSLQIEKANEINKLLGKETRTKDIAAGKILRMVIKNQQSGWTATPLSYIEKAFPGIFTCMGLLKEKFPLVFEGEWVYSKYAYEMEIYLAEKINSLVMRNKDNELRQLNLPKIINPLQIDEDIKLTDEQLLALDGALEKSISVITGGAGCGKTTLIKQIVKNLEYRQKDFLLTSFTGKAVLRIKDTLGTAVDNKCFTMSRLIHKKIKFQEVPKFKVLIIDEASMISGSLLYDFMKVFKHTFRIILIGDCNQLPPIGLCSVFQEIIKSQTVPIYRLSENLRIKDKEKSSNILLNANQLISRERDIKTPYNFVTGKGFEILEGDLNICQKIVTALANKGVQMSEITVLTPFNRDVGIINMHAQKTYLKGAQSVVYANKEYILGDRVMQTVNVYNEEGEVMNGEEGIIHSITKEYLEVKYSEEKIIKYQWNNDLQEKKEEEDNSEKEFLTSDLSQSFCKTVHKSQGSEYDYVIFFLAPYIGSFVNINLLYTAITRTKKTIWLVVDKQSLDNACKTPLGFRYEKLAERLKQF